LKTGSESGYTKDTGKAVTKEVSKAEAVSLIEEMSKKSGDD